MTTFDRFFAGIVILLLVSISAVVAAGDRAGVGVVRIVPADGSTPSITTSMSIEFSQPMDRASVEKRIAIMPGIKFAVSWEGNTLVLRPEQPLDPGRKYTLTVSDGAESRIGRFLKPFSASFVPRRPSVIYRTPDHPEWLLEISSKGGEPRIIYTAVGKIDDISVSSNGERIALTVIDNQDTANVWILDRSGGNSQRITDCASGYCGRARWSPDGKTLSYEKQEDTGIGEGWTGQIWLYDIASGVQTPLFEDETQSGHDAIWGERGGRLAFVDSNLSAIEVLEIGNGEMIFLPSQLGEIGSLSPDGESMVYADLRVVGGQVFPELWLADLTPAVSLKQLLDNAEEDQNPVWSPDGQWITFTRRRLDRQGGLGSQIMLYSVDSKQLRQLTIATGYNNISARWDPGSGILLIERFELAGAGAAPSLWIYSLKGDTFTLLDNHAWAGRWAP